MKKIFLTSFWVFIFTILFTSGALAQSKTKAIVKLPTFMAGEAQVVDKDIDGDLMVAGRQVKITSNVKGDAYVAGRDVEVTGNIDGDLVVAGMNVTISGKVLKNLIMAGGQIIITDSATIGGYVLTGGNKVDLLGDFSGPVRLGAGTLVVGQKAIINGSLEADVNKSEIASDSKITGEKNIRIHEVKKQEVNRNEIKQIGYAGKIISFLSKLLILLVFVKLFGQRFKQIDIKGSFWSAMGNGLLLLVEVPLLFLILLVTVIAAPLSMIILNAYLLTVYLSSIVVSILIGTYIAEKINLKTNIYLNGIFGLMLITLIKLIPMVGGLVSLIIFLLGTGVVFKSLKIYFSKQTTK
jgi:hypothetical protein